MEKYALLQIHLDKHDKEKYMDFHHAQMIHILSPFLLALLPHFF